MAGDQAGVPSSLHRKGFCVAKSDGMWAAAQPAYFTFSKTIAEDQPGRCNMTGHQPVGLPWIVPGRYNYALKVRELEFRFVQGVLSEILGVISDRHASSGPNLETQTRLCFRNSESLEPSLRLSQHCSTIFDRIGFIAPHLLRR